MALWVQLLLALLFGPLLWLAGAIFFDFVHAVLHAMLRSRWSLVRGLAWPHAVHHQWIDDRLEVRWENQSANIWCHIVPEYLTQLLFTVAVAVVLPLPFAGVLLLLQTAAFAGILRLRGLDLNHRPIEWLDAYRPSWMTPPAYHALHHVHPNAYYSAYGKFVDIFLGTASELCGRHVTLVAADSPFGEALSAKLRSRGVREIDRTTELDWAGLGDTDILVLCRPTPDEESIVEALAEATRTRKLPPEIWVVHTNSEEPLARHYVNDVRLHYRSIVMSKPDRIGPEAAEIAAARALERITRGAHLVSTGPRFRALAEVRRFRALAPRRPARSPRVRSRAEWATG